MNIVLSAVGLVITAFLLVSIAGLGGVVFAARQAKKLGARP